MDPVYKLIEYLQPDLYDQKKNQGLDRKKYSTQCEKLLK